MGETARQARARRNRVRVYQKWAPLGSAVVFIVVAFVYQPHLGAGLRTDWWVAASAFLVGTLTFALPRWLPIPVTLAGMAACAVMSNFVVLAGFTLACFLLCGMGVGAFFRRAPVTRA